jgi:hypothetical protein
MAKTPSNPFCMPYPDKSGSNQYQMRHLNPPEVDKSARFIHRTFGGRTADKYGKSGPKFSNPSNPIRGYISPCNQRNPRPIFLCVLLCLFVADLSV